MPRPLQNPVVKVDASLAVVCPRNDVGDVPQPAGVPVKAGQVDFHKVAEALVGQQNFSAGIHPAEPRGPVLRLHRIDEARLRTTGLLHQVKDGLQSLHVRRRLEDQRIVGLLPVVVVVEPEVLLGRGKAIPLRITIRY